MEGLLNSYEFWATALAVITGVIGYFTGKRKNAAEAESIEVLTNKELLTTYKGELEFFSKQLILTREEIKELRTEISILSGYTCTRANCELRINNSNKE